MTGGDAGGIVAPAVESARRGDDAVGVVAPAIVADGPASCDDAEVISRAERIELAIKAFHDGMHIRKSAKKYGVPYTSLRRHLKRKITGVPNRGRKPWLGQETEDQLAEWCHEMMKIGCPVSKSDLAQTVKSILDINEIKMFPSDNLPSRNWIKKFLKRHPNVSSLVPEDLDHLKAYISYSDIESFFDGISELLKNDYGIDPAEFLSIDNGSRIFNCDESEFFLNSANKSSKVLVQGDSKNSYEGGGEGKLMMTVLFCVSALGDIVRPLIVNKGKNPTVYERFEDLDMNSYAVAASNSGWMTADIFYSWLANIFHKDIEEKNITRPVILFLDCHSSHISLETINFARDHEIIMYCIPPHASHILQPLDVAVFKSVQAKYREVIAECFGTSAETHLAKKNFPYVLMKAVKRSRIKENSVSGFEVTGIVPFNPFRIKQDKLLRSVEEQRQDIQESIASEDEQEEPTIFENVTSEENLKAVCMAAYKAAQSDCQARVEAIIPPYMMQCFRNISESEVQQEKLDTLFYVWRELTTRPPCGDIPNLSLCISTPSSSPALPMLEFPSPSAELSSPSLGSSSSQETTRELPFITLPPTSEPVVGPSGFVPPIQKAPFRMKTRSSKTKRRKNPFNLSPLKDYFATPSDLVIKKGMARKETIPRALTGADHYRHHLAAEKKKIATKRKRKEEREAKRQEKMQMKSKGKQPTKRRKTSEVGSESEESSGDETKLLSDIESKSGEVDSGDEESACGVCLKAEGGARMWIGCGSCSKWYHKHCVDISLPLSSRELKSFKYICSNCS